MGCNFIKVAIERYKAKIFASIHKHNPLVPVSFEYDMVDMCNRDQILKTAYAFKPDAIIHFAFLNDFNMMYTDRKLGWQSLVESTRYLLEAARDNKAKMILISTDWVFDGTQSNADETTPPNPINYYGVLKVVGETLVTEMIENGAVARVSGVYGSHWARPEWKASQNPGFGYLPNTVVETLHNHQPFTVYDGNVNVRATPTLASDAAEMIMQIIKRDRCGIFHCCGGECITRFELARRTAEVFDLDPDLIQIGPVDPGDPSVVHNIHIPKDTCLNASYTSRELSHPLLDIRQALKKFRRQLELNKL